MNGYSITGWIIFLVAFGIFYDVFFNRESSEYWRTSLFGGKFKAGCVTPVILLMVGCAFIVYGKESEEQQERKIENNGKSAASVKKLPVKPKNVQEQKEIFSDSKVANLSLKEFKKFVNDNYKKMMKKREQKLLKKLLNLEIQRITRENKQLVEEMKIIKRMELSKEERSKRIVPIKKQGKANIARIKELKEGLAYVDKLFGAKK